jgi:hypothetical protein
MRFIEYQRRYICFMAEGGDGSADSYGEGSDFGGYSADAAEDAQAAAEAAAQAAAAEAQAGALADQGMTPDSTSIGGFSVDSNPSPEVTMPGVDYSANKGAPGYSESLAGAYGMAGMVGTASPGAAWGKDAADAAENRGSVEAVAAYNAAMQGTVVADIEAINLQDFMTWANANPEQIVDTVRSIGKTPDGQMPQLVAEMLMSIGITNEMANAMYSPHTAPSVESVKGAIGKGNPLTALIAHAALTHSLTSLDIGRAWNQATAMLSLPEMYLPENKWALDLYDLMNGKQGNVDMLQSLTALPGVRAAMDIFAVVFPNSVITLSQLEMRNGVMVNVAFDVRGRGANGVYSINPYDAVNPINSPISNVLTSKYLTEKEGMQIYPDLFAYFSTQFNPSAETIYAAYIMNSDLFEMDDNGIRAGGVYMTDAQMQNALGFDVPSFRKESTDFQRALKLDKGYSLIDYMEQYGKTWDQAVPGGLKIKDGTAIDEKGYRVLLNDIQKEEEKYRNYGKELNDSYWSTATAQLAQSLVIGSPIVGIYNFIEAGKSYSEASKDFPKEPTNEQLIAMTQKAYLLYQATPIKAIEHYVGDKLTWVSEHTTAGFLAPAIMDKGTDAERSRWEMTNLYNGLKGVDPTKRDQIISKYSDGLLDWRSVESIATKNPMTREELIAISNRVLSPAERFLYDLLSTAVLTAPFDIGSIPLMAGIQSAKAANAVTKTERAIEILSKSTDILTYNNMANVERMAMLNARLTIQQAKATKLERAFVEWYKRDPDWVMRDLMRDGAKANINIEKEIAKLGIDDAARARIVEALGHPNEQFKNLMLRAHMDDKTADGIIELQTKYSNALEHATTLGFKELGLSPEMIKAMLPGLRGTTSWALLQKLEDLKKAVLNPTKWSEYVAKQDGKYHAILRAINPASTAHADQLKAAAFMYGLQRAQARVLGMLEMSEIKMMGRSLKLDSVGYAKNAKFTGDSSNPLSTHFMNIFDHPEWFTIDGKLASKVPEIQKILRGVEKSREMMAKAGIDWQTMPLDEYTHYFSHAIDEAKMGKGGGVRGSPDSQKWREYKNVDEGIKGGIKYMTDYRAVVYKMYSEAYEQAAKHNFIEYVSSMSKQTVSEVREARAVTESLARQLERSIATLKTVETANPKEIALMESQLSAARKELGMKAPTEYPDLVEVPFPKGTTSYRQFRIDQLNEEIARIKELPDTETLVIQLEEELKSLDIKPLEMKVASLESELERLQSLPSTKAVQDSIKNIESRVVTANKELKELATPAIKDVPETMGLKFNPQVLKEITDALRTENIGIALRALSGIGDVSRFVLTGFDLGAPFIHGLPTLFTHSPEWATGWVSQFKAMMTEKWIAGYFTANKEFMKTAITKGQMVFDASEFVRGANILGKLGQPFSRAFSGFLDTTKLELWKSMYREGMSGREAADLGAHIEKLTGTLSSARTGRSARQALIESAVVFAPRYYLSSISLMTDLFRTGTNPILALKALAGYQAGMYGWYYAVSSLGKELGVFEEGPILDPFHEGYMGFRIKGTDFYIKPGGFMRTFDLMIARVGIHIANDEPDKVLPTLLRYAQSKSSRLVAIGTNLITGKDYIGRGMKGNDKLGWLFDTVVLNSMPFAVQSAVLDALPSMSGLDRWGVGLMEFFGFGTVPHTATRESRDMLDQISMKRHGINYETLVKKDPGAAINITNIPAVHQALLNKQEEARLKGASVWDIVAQQSLVVAPQITQESELHRVTVNNIATQNAKGIIDDKAARAQWGEEDARYYAAMANIYRQVPELAAKVSSIKNLPKGLSVDTAAYEAYKTANNDPRLKGLDGADRWSMTEVIKQEYELKWPDSKNVDGKIVNWWNNSKSLELTAHGYHNTYVMNKIDNMELGDKDKNGVSVWDLIRKKDAPNGQAKINEYLFNNPYKEALLFIKGYTWNLQTQTSYNMVKGLMADRGIDKNLPLPMDQRIPRFEQSNMLYQKAQAASNAIPRGTQRDEKVNEVYQKIEDALVKIRSLETAAKLVVNNNQMDNTIKTLYNEAGKIAIWDKELKLLLEKAGSNPFTHYVNLRMDYIRFDQQSRLSRAAALGDVNSKPNRMTGLDTILDKHPFK